MQPEEIRQKILQYQKQGQRLFVTSSFQTHSIPLLHIISRIDNSIPVFFMNTGFLFPETLKYKDEVQQLLKLNIKGLRSAVPRINQRAPDGKLLFTTDPDQCCYINKIQPLEPVLTQYDVWINGIRADQNDNRKNMKVEQQTPQGALRFHPMLDWTSKDIETYIKENNLPRHPLE